MEKEMAAKHHELHLQELGIIRQQALQGQLQASREQELFQAKQKNLANSIAGGPPPRGLGYSLLLSQTKLIEQRA